jgi:uncharacterized damage-inducible protein DinB
MIRIRPDFAMLPQFYTGYVKLVQEWEVIEALTRSAEEMYPFTKSIPESKGDFRYASGKWSVKELLCHVMDAERIFAYRALRFARMDETELPGFDEGSYAPRANAQSRTIAELAEEMRRLRATTIDLFRSFTPEMLKCAGKANGSLISVVNLGYVIAGHETHHRRILTDRYLTA